MKESKSYYVKVFVPDALQPVGLPGTAVAFMDRIEDLSLREVMEVAANAKVLGWPAYIRQHGVNYADELLGTEAVDYA